MAKLVDILKWSISLGRSPQTFLGAKWVRRVLERAPEHKKRIWALRLLSLSPHYFINPDSPEFKGLSGDAYLEKAFNVGLESRQLIFDRIVKPHVSSDDVVIDYGCGPGFLCAALAPNVGQVYGCDISEGALESARILNSAPNLEYVLAVNGLKPIKDASADVIVSFAMAQHLTAEVLDNVLENCRKKLKPGGKLLLHVQLIDDVWRSENDWRSDHSFKGRLKFRYGLHCFGRSGETYRDVVEGHGFTDVELLAVADLVPESGFDDIGSQQLLLARKV